MEILGELLRDTTLWVVIGGLSIVLFVGSLLALPRVVARLPVDYFVRDGRPAGEQRPSFFAAVARNTVGAVLIAMGIAMLVLPGQGVLTILMGVAVADFPGKHRLERRLAGQRHVRRSLQWMRKRAQRPLLAFGDDDGGPTGPSEGAA